MIVRDTAEQAWAVAQDQLDHMSEERDRRRAPDGRYQPSRSGWDRQQALHGWRKPKYAQELEIAPNLWSGLALVRPGPGITLVGDPESVAARNFEYQDIGFDTFIISGFPLVEEAYRVADDPAAAAAPSATRSPRPRSSPPSAHRSSRMSDQLWYTRCPVPTERLGVQPRLARTALRHPRRIHRNPAGRAARHRGAPLRPPTRRLDPGRRQRAHVRGQGGGRAERLVGLTWIEERQAIVVRPGSSITTAAQLEGAGVAIPAWANCGGTSMGRAMAIQGFRGALSLADLTLEDVRWVEVHNAGTGTVLPPLTSNLNNGRDFWGFDDLLRGDVDAI